jgi:hypothetical protein
MSIKGSLKDVFKLAVAGGALAASFVVGGYLGSLVFDPFFFPIIHDPTNLMGKALIEMTSQTFGFIHEWMGLTGDGGLLNWGPFKELMAPWVAKVTPVVPMAGVGEDILMDIPTN